MPHKPMPSLQRVQELCSYDPRSGIVTWKVGRKAGRPAGRKSHFGYLVMYVDCRAYMAHRIAWLLFYGTPPVDQIDHINCRRDDNRIENLRAAHNQENNANRGPNKNNAFGFKGVTPKRGRWQAQIKVNYRNHYIGLFATPEEAHEAYLAKAKEAFGRFARGSV